MTPKDIVQRSIEQLLARHDQIKAELEAIPVAAETEQRGLNPDEETRFDALLALAGVRS